MTSKVIAFYSPLKPVTHSTPSGDRLMAQLLIECMQRSGHQVEIASHLRTILKDSDDESTASHLISQARSEIQRLTQRWQSHGMPDIWVCYHPYYKSPDLIGPALCETFGIAYITLEASYSPRRQHGWWGSFQQKVLDSVMQAAANICFTDRDRVGLQRAAPDARFVNLRPFIDPAEYQSRRNTPRSPHLVTVAMMRPGDKMSSYTHLAIALKQLLHLPWVLSVVGDGPQEPAVRSLFSEFPESRVIWHGRMGSDNIAVLFSECSIYVWPGCGEAYGLAYLEAQAAGLPVVAFETAGVPEVVCSGYSGLLTQAQDDSAFASAIARLLENHAERDRLSGNARKHVHDHHSIDKAAATLNEILLNSLEQ